MIHTFMAINIHEKKTIIIFYICCCLFSICSKWIFANMIQIDYLNNTLFIGFLLLGSQYDTNRLLEKHTFYQIPSVLFHSKSPLLFCYTKLNITRKTLEELNFIYFSDKYNNTNLNLDLIKKKFD